jgi:hypothetical protein
MTGGSKGKNLKTLFQQPDLTTLSIEFVAEFQVN